MRSPHARIFICLAVVAMVGCHKMNVEQVTATLRIGMSKAELDVVMKHERYLKVQTVQVRPGSDERQTRAAVRNNKIYEFIFPKNLIDEALPFDGSIKAYSYLIKEEKEFANPINVEALFVFVDQKKDQVIGWAVIDGLVEARLWRDFF